LSILQKTTNFFELYRHICGESEVPSMYHFWCAVSLISATVEDRIWFEKFKHEKLYPNLFIMLVGPSGLGKGTAIGHLVRLSECAISVNRFRGRVTAAHLIDHLGKPHLDEWGQRALSNPRLWLIMDELKNDVSSNRKMVEEFIYLMTELYTASNYTIDTGTRTHGKVRVDKPIINWLAGTNEEDLRDIITKELLNSGFVARTCFVFGEYNFGKRIPKIKYPYDYEEIFQHLCYRLWALQRTHGRMLITDSADAEMDKWYMTRPNPREELLYSTWKRHHDLILKFSMILCLGDCCPLVIQQKHVVNAKRMVDKVFKFGEDLVAIGSERNSIKDSNTVARYIKGKKRISHTIASRYFRSLHGMNSVKFRKAINDLLVDRLIEIEKTTTKATFYLWRG